MYKNIWFDYRRNRIFLRESFSGKTVKSSIDINFEYFIEDPAKTSPIKDIFGTPVVQKIAKDSGVVDSLKRSGIKCYETDIAEDTKFLQTRYKGLDIKPDFSAFNTAYLDIEVASESDFPKPEEAKWPINLISVYFSKTKEMFTFGSQPRDGLHNYFYCPDEKRLLERFISVFRKNKVDIITGWYVKGFDIKYIVNRCKKFGIQKFLSPYLPLDRIVANKKTGEYSIPGISILDYRDLYKNKTFVPGNKESYTLQFISMHELGEGKLEYEGQIYDLYKTDWNKFVDYNRQDVMLVFKLEQKLKLIELAINICYQSLIPFERIFSSVQVITGLIMRKLKMKNLVMPDKKHSAKDEEDEYDGGYVEAYPGRYDKVVNRDVTSMYPHMIMMYNISPETLRLNPSSTDGLIRTPVPGTYYDRKVKGIIPQIVEEIFLERKKFKKLMAEADKKGDKELSKYYYDQQMTRKILINSMYGVLGNQWFHFYNIKNAEAVTLSGQHLIKHLSNSVNEYFRNYFHKDKTFFPVSDEKNRITKNVCVYLDTDSNYIRLDEIQEKIAPNEDFLTWARKFDKEFLDVFFAKVLQIYADGFEIPQLISFKREKILAQQLILSKKHYVCEVLEDADGKVYDPPKFHFTGIESERSDVPRFCRDRIAETIRHILKTKDKDSSTELIREIKKIFVSTKVESIASPTGINDYDKYADQMQVKNTKFGGRQLIYPAHVPIHSRASINYNMLVNMKNLKVAPIGNGSKIRYIYTKTNNILEQNVIAFIGNYPEEFNTLFQIDYDLQFEKTFLAAIQRVYDAMDWGEIKFNRQKLGKFFK